MAVESPGFIFIQSGGETAERARRALAAYAGLRGGIVAAGDLAVTENGTPNMSVNVATGQVLIPGTEGTYQGHYVIENRGTLNVALAAADATNPRKDLIVAKVQDAAYSGASNVASIVVVTGTPAGSPAEPAIPANAWVLAMVDVPALDTAITNSQITDRRTQQTGQKGRGAALGGVVVCTSTNRPSHSEGLVIYETDTDVVSVSDGTNWNQIKPGGPRGKIAAGAGNTSAQGSITTEVDITGATGATADPGGGRRVRITLSLGRITSTVGGDTYDIAFYEGGSVIMTWRVIISQITGGVGGTFSHQYVPTTGSKTWKATIQRANGSGTLSINNAATAPLTFLVEDIGT
jgi:hypothetical protein